MNSLQPHTKIKGRQASLRNAKNTVASSHQKSQHAEPHVRDNSHTLPVQSPCDFEPLDRPRELMTYHRESRQTEDERPHASSIAGEVCSSTDQPASAYLSLQHYSDYVVMVPTPRTSSPLPDRYPTSGKLQTDVSVNLELEQGSGKVVGDDDHDNRSLAGRQRSKDVVRNRGSSQLQKTVGRLKRYFGLAAACGTSSESQRDDVSCNSNGAGCLPPQAQHDEEIEADDVNKLQVKRRTHSHNDSLDTAADMRLVLRPNHTDTRRMHHQPGKYQISHNDELKPKHRHDPSPSLMERKSVEGVKVSVDDLALATVVPGIRVRVPPHRQLSHHERLLTDSNRVVGTTQTGSWLDDAHARSRANVERWLNQNSEADTGRLCSTLSRQHHHRHSVQRGASHVHSASRVRSRVSETSNLSRMERSMSEINVRRPAAVDHFRSRDQHRMASNSSSVPGTPNMAGSTGVDGESRLGPSLVRLVAEIIEGLEQRSRDDSSAVWSGIRGTGTPASKIFQQLTSRIRDTDSLTRSPAAIEDRRSEDTAGLKGSAASPGENLIPQDKTRNGNRNEVLSEKTLTGRRESLEEGATAESGEQKSSGMVPACSVAVLRHRLLRAVEGNSNRRTAVAERPIQHRRTESKDSETTTGNFQPSALINCRTGTTCRDFVGCVSCKARARQRCSGLVYA